MSEKTFYRFQDGQPDTDFDDFDHGKSLTTGEAILAVAVRFKNNRRINYFLTLGKPFHRICLWEIAKRVLQRAKRWSHSLDGIPEETEICYSLQDAAAEPYFYEQYLELVRTISSIRSESDRERIRQELEEGGHLYFLGSPKERRRSQNRYWSMRKSPLRKPAGHTPSGNFRTT